MDEKILIKSERYGLKKCIILLCIIGVVLSAIGFAIRLQWEMEYWENRYAYYAEHQAQGYHFDSWEELWEPCRSCDLIEENPNKADYALREVLEYYWYDVLTPVVAFSLLGLILYLFLHSYELIVTDKRIYGKIAWGKRVDLPVDSISAISSVRGIKGVTVATSAGKIKFIILKNANDIYGVINKLLIERQTIKNDAIAGKDIQMDVTDQLKKYKELLDSGAISQEEYDAKKKQLLDL